MRLCFGFLICLLGCVLVWAVWKERCDKLQEKRQSNQGKSNHATMSPQPSAMGRSITEANPSLVKLVGGAPSIGESKTSSEETGNNCSDSDFFAHQASIHGHCTMPQPLPPNKMGVTYSRSLTGTRMPSKERFQTRPMGRAFKRCLLSRNFSFRE